MPSFSLTPAQLASLRLLPGRALIKVAPIRLTTDSGLHLPQAAAEAHEHAQILREGTVTLINPEPHTNPGIAVHYLNPAGLLNKRVLYFTHLDEVDNEYVIVLHGQIVAVVGD